MSKNKSSVYNGITTFLLSSLFIAFFIVVIVFWVRVILAVIKPEFS